MSAADPRAAPITDVETASLFADLADCKALVLAVSGGPDSTALLLLAARWRDGLRDGPSLLAATIDHGLRPEARREAAAVKRFAASLGVAHRTLRWKGPKPKTGLQEAARAVRYRLLAAAAARAKARHILTAHTLDDQAETVLFRLARGTGVAGLGGMARIAPLQGFHSSLRSATGQLKSPSGAAARRSLPRSRGRVREGAEADGDAGHKGGSESAEGFILIRPFLGVPKARLIATLAAARIPFAEDPSNEDPRFARARLRALTPALAAEGLTPARLAQVARRVRRANDAIEAAVDRLAAELAPDFGAALEGAAAPSVEFSVTEWAKAPEEIRLRLLGRFIARLGDEGDVELGKLESCEQAAMKHLQRRSAERFRRTLAGAAVTLAGDRLIVSRAPPRRTGGEGRKGGKNASASRSVQLIQPERKAQAK